MAVIAFSPQNGKAEIFTQDMTDPKTGRAYMMALSQKPKASRQTQSHQTASRPTTPGPAGRR
jgi:hypothetical protein